MVTVLPGRGAAQALNTLDMNEESARLAKALIDFREAEGISVKELAMRTGLSQATIRLHESDRGRLPTHFAAHRLEEVLGLAPGSISAASYELGEDEPPPDSGAAGRQADR